MFFMPYISNGGRDSFTRGGQGKPKIYKRRWFKIVAPIVVVLILVGGTLAWKADSVLRKISDSGLLSTVVHSLPGVDDKLKGEEEGRINILLLGMRGANDPAGGTLADTIMVLSIKPAENKASLISIPRDLYVDNPAVGYKTKINAVFAYGEKDGRGEGMKLMEQTVGDITGIPIHYAVTTNFDGFKKIIDIVGGIQITLDKPFEEAVQFDKPHVCDSFFTIPTGEYENKTVKYFSQESGVYKTRIVKSYPLCTAPVSTLECGGDFKLPAGTQTLDSNKTLCYARSRETSNDFERAKRQQQVLKAVKDKLLSMGVLADFGKVNDIINNVGDNVKTDMQAWEMKKFYDIYKQMEGYTLYQRVLDASDDPESGLVYGKNDETAGAILIPKGDNFDRIKSLFQNIFTLEPQKDPSSPSSTNLPGATGAGTPASK